MHQHAEGTVPCTDINASVCLREIRPLGAHHGVVTGYLFNHDTEEMAARCGGIIGVAGVKGVPLWTPTGRLAEGNLTLDPSVLCGCGFHGFVRDGGWVMA